jgi:hypothetical protein
MTPDAPAVSAPEAPAAGLSEILTKEVTGSADAYRNLGEIFVSVLAAIPSATLLTTLIRAPGNASVDEPRLAGGLMLAAVALALGVWFAVWLRTPVEVTEEELKDFPMTRIIGTRQPTYDRLLDRIDQLQQEIAAAADDAGRKAAERHYRAVLATLRSVHALASADRLRTRVLSDKSKWLSGCALLATTASVFLLATAPKSEEAQSAAAPAAPAVVHVKLTHAGVDKLGCSKKTFDAIRFGGTAAEPQLVPLGRVTCTAGTYITVKVAAKPTLASSVEPSKPASP